MNRVNFTANWIKSLKCPKDKDRIEFTDDVVPSLTLRVGKRTKKFYSRYRDGRKIKRVKLGAFPALTVTEARRRARLSEFERNTIEEEKRIQITFAEVFQMYSREYLPTLKESTSKDYENRIKRYILPKLGNANFDQIEQAQIKRLLLDMRNTAPTTSERVKAILSSIYSYARDKNLIDINPIQGLGKIYKEKRRERIYTTDEMFSILKCISDFNEPYRSNMMLIILTGQRVGEINSLKWSDVDLSEMKITIRAENTKNANQQVLPILPEIKIILAATERYSKGVSEFLFPVEPDFKTYRRSMSSLLKKVKKLSGVSDFRLHDIRSKLATVLAERGIDRVTVGKLLNHKQMAGDNSVTGYHYDLYNYNKQKSAALEEWHRYLYEDVLKKGYVYRNASKFYKF